MPTVRLLAAGLAAGAAGTTALNAVTYADVAARGRPTSDTPQETVERLATNIGADVPGEGQVRDNRVQGLGPLLGIATGVGVGAVAGLARRLGWRPPLVVDALAITALAAVAANAPMTVLGVSDPGDWSIEDWTADVVPHLAYGLVTAAALHAIDDER